MLDSTYFWLATTAIVALLACYVLFLVKFRLTNESSDFSDFPDLLQETSDELLLRTSKNLSAKRREELLEKIRGKNRGILGPEKTKNNLTSPFFLCVWQMLLALIIQPEKGQ